MEWVSIRGPIGPHRQDVYTSFVAMHAGKPYPEGADIDLSKFPMPWVKPDPEPEPEVIRITGRKAVRRRG